jgi:hypothetical protein
MPFCPACRSEFRPGFTRCEECGVDLVETLPIPDKHPRVPDPAFHTVYSTTDLVEAETIRILLSGRGIEAEVQNRHSGFSVIEVGPTSAAPLLITVPAADAAEAASILQETQKFRSTRPMTNRRMWWVAALLVGGPLLLAGLIALMDLLSS